MHPSHDAVGNGTVDDLPYSGIDMLTDEGPPPDAAATTTSKSPRSVSRLGVLCAEVFDLLGDEVPKEWDRFVSDLDVN